MSNPNEKPRLIGSAATLSDLAELIRKRWTWSDVEFKSQPNGTYSVNNQPDLRVVLKRGRYRLEIINE